jgi:hypothetical protein
MKKLIQQRDRVIAKLLELAPQILLGSSSETYRTCGNPKCRCHSTGPKHGPHIYVNYRGEDGRSTGYYVPKALEEQVTQGLAAWREFYMLTKNLAKLNKEIMDSERAKK